MKREPIKVGAKSKSARAQLTLAYNRSETVADCLSLCEGNEAAVASLFNRGYTIWLQDRFGRPMFEANEDAAKIQATFDSAVPGKTKGISTRAPKVLTPEDTAALMKASQKGDKQAMAALLAKYNVKAIIE